MKIRFVTPQKELRKGGIENAVEGLRGALMDIGVQVVDGADPTDRESVHHFHGLWNPSHTRLTGLLHREGCPYVVSPHGMLEPWAFRHRRWKKLPYFWFFEKRMLLHAESLFVTSELERVNLRRVLRHPQVQVLSLGCRDVRGEDYQAARLRLGWNAEERVMVFLSRVDPKKGLHLLIEALASVPEEKFKWRLVVVGDGPAEYLTRLKRQEQSLRGRLPRIDWKGPIWGENRWRYLQAANLFVLPTHSENFGIAVLEALHAGTPVLTTSGTPWRDYAGYDGITICEPKADSIRAGLMAAISRVESGWSPTDRQRLASWAQENFSWSKLAPQYLEAYQRAGKRL